jgi:DNA-binding MarR family transcriptional regulator
LVRRVAHPNDRRTTLAEITTEGRTLMKVAAEALNTTVFANVGLSVTDTNGLNRILKSFRAGAGDFHA